MTSIPLVRQVAIAPAMTYLDALGVPVNAYLRRSRLTRPRENALEMLIPLHQVSSFLSDVAQSEGIDRKLLSKPLPAQPMSIPKGKMKRLSKSKKGIQIVNKQTRKRATTPYDSMPKFVPRSWGATRCSIAIPRILEAERFS